MSDKPKWLITHPFRMFNASLQKDHILLQISLIEKTLVLRQSHLAVYPAHKHHLFICCDQIS